MAHTPHTWATGDTITAPLLNSLEADLAAAITSADNVSADKVVDGTTNKAYTAAEKTKLAGVATGATANATDAALRDRSTHTGTQAVGTITGLSTVATSGAYTDLSAKPTIPTVGAAGAGAAVALSSTDAAVTNARTPTAHAASHAAGGADAITPASIGGTPILTPTAVKTTAYTAVVGDLAMMNVTGGATTLTLPTAPANRAQVGYRAIGATAAVPLVVTAGGADTIGTAGATSASIPLADEVTVLQYDAPNARWLAVSNVKTQAALDARYAGQVTKTAVTAAGLAPQPGPVAGAYQVTGQTSNGTDVGVNTMTKHVLPAGVGLEMVRLRFTNSGAASNGDVDNANAITVVSSIGASNIGPWYPVRRAGSRTMVLDPGADIETDPVAFHVAPGGTFYTKTFLSVTSGQVWYAQVQAGSIGTDFWASQSTTETDLSQSTAAFTATTGNRSYAPVAIISDTHAPTQARVAIIGDSIAGGIGDAAGTSGFAWRALNTVLPWSRISVSGSRIKGLIDPNVGRRRMVLVRGANTALIMYGTNDIFTDAATLATLQGYHVTLWGMLRNLGIKPTVCTILPNTTSTDSWATTANQTLKTGEATRTAFNDWLRDGAPMLNGAAAATGSNAGGTLRAGAAGHLLAGYFETADIAESARNSGLWKVTGAANYATADGTHPTTAMATLLSAAVTPATFTALAAS